MTLNKSIAVLTFVLLCTLFYAFYAHADTVAQYAPTYSPPGLLPTGAEGKKAGMVISLQTDEDISKQCDFTHQIVVTRNSVLCVFNGYRGPTNPLS